MKKIPLEVLFKLDQQLMHLPNNGKARRALIADTAAVFNISEDSVYRQLRALNLHQRERKTRSDKGNSRILPEKELHYYCQIIAALKFASTNGNRHMLSTEECIRRLESGEVTVKNKIVTLSHGILKRSTVNNYLEKYYISPDQLAAESTVNHFQACYSNQCWQLDITPSELYRFPDQHPDDPRKVMSYSVVDDLSRVAYSEYRLAEGEDALNVLEFLYKAIAKITSDPSELHGIPDFLYIDNGSFSSSRLFKRVVNLLGMKLLSHLPRGCGGRKTTARAKGKVERQHRTIKSGLEPIYKLHVPQNLDEANQMLAQFIAEQNNKKHPTLMLSKIEVWKQNMPKDYNLSICSYEQYQSLMREPFDRQVKSDATVQINGIHYQLSPQFAGEKVTILLGVNTNEVCVIYKDQEFGPFYPISPPTEFGTYHHHKKSEKEYAADNVINLSKDVGLNIVRPTPSIFSTAQNIKATLIAPQKVYESKLAAKLAISKYLGIALAELTDKQRQVIDNLTDKTLIHQELMDAISHYFQLKLVSNKD
ncbi:MULTISPECIES: DDE-type integrase/transposase/recombinase [Cysteiniphilum]|uniref:Integrase catalytic domain-containing protein n=1 Tax=Cysteiniphilum litorale TaxID=2056700 RepID=A0A8J2Z6M4_9GAMM|nr:MULTISPECIES: DDE-type integrase/transposase/recombinase [Cysteiniphilum]GGG06519.1 hypothetical protein GCM10010995_25030 [Cysteiniphilum litorale]